MAIQFRGLTHVQGSPAFVNNQQQALNAQYLMNAHATNDQELVHLNGPDCAQFLKDYYNVDLPPESLTWTIEDLTKPQVISKILELMPRRQAILSDVFQYTANIFKFYLERKAQGSSVSGQPITEIQEPAV